MALYLIGDIQGCNAAFKRLLRTIDFSPSRDTIYVLGDMVNRGEDSTSVLQTLMDYGTSARCVLGNHDLHLLAVASGVRSARPDDTLDAILNAPSKDTLLAWLRHQKLAIALNYQSQNWLLVHAGVLPQWSADQTLSLAAEVETALQSTDYIGFLKGMYGSMPHQWSDVLAGADRLRVIVSGLTRLRFCDANGVMDFASKEGANSAPAGFMPWFEVPHRQTQDVSIAFGHWSRLGLFYHPNLEQPKVLGLDTGCVWGGELTCYQLGAGIQSVKAA